MKANQLIFTSGVGVIHIQWLRFDFYIVLFSSPFSRFDIMHFCQVGNSRRQTQTIEGTVYPRFDRTFYLWVRQLFFISRQMINLHLQWPRWYVGGPRGLNLWWKQWHRGGQCTHGKGDYIIFLHSLWCCFLNTIQKFSYKEEINPITTSLFERI